MDEKSKKITYITIKEQKEDGTLDPRAVEKNMLMEAKRDGDEVMQKIVDGSLPLGEDPWSKALGFKKDQFDEMFEDASNWFDKHGEIKPELTTPQYSEPAYVFTSPPKKESLLKRVFSWMKRKITKNT